MIKMSSLVLLHSSSIVNSPQGLAGVENYATFCCSPFLLASEKLVEKIDLNDDGGVRYSLRLTLLFKRVGAILGW